MRKVTVLLLISALMAVSQAGAEEMAATLKDLNGKVLMNKGSGLVSGKPGTALQDGDRIITLDKSGARIVFTDGCDVTLEENMIFVINSQLGCKAIPVTSNPPPVAPTAAGLTNAQGLLIGTAYVGGGAIIGNSVSNSNKNNNDNRPISTQ